MAGNPHVGDVGTPFRVTVKNADGSTADISTTTVRRVLFLRPDKSLLAKNAGFYTDGTDGIMQYLSASGDLSSEGRWKIQGYIEYSGGSVAWHTDEETFRVEANLGDS